MWFRGSWAAWPSLLRYWWDILGERHALVNWDCWAWENEASVWSKRHGERQCLHAIDGSPETIKPSLLLGRNVMTNLDSILKSSDITLPTKFHLVKAMVFPVVIYGCESWTVKKAECRRINTFELRCWRRLLRVPGTARRSNQSILKEISPGCLWKDWC